MASGLAHGKHQRLPKRVARPSCLRLPKFLLFAQFLLLTIPNVTAVPQPRATSRYRSLQISHPQNSVSKTLLHQRTNPSNRLILPSSNKTVYLRVGEKDLENQSSHGNYPSNTPFSQMKGKVKSYRGKSHQHTQRARRRGILSAESTSETEDATSHEEEETEQGHEEGDEEEENEEEEEGEEEGEEEHHEEGERDLSASGTVQQPRSSESHKEGQYSREEMENTIRTAAEGDSEEDATEANSVQEIPGKNSERETEQAEPIQTEPTQTEPAQAIDNYQDPGKEDNPTTDGVSKNSNVFRGVAGGAVDGTNITQVSLMVYKLVKAHDIKTIVDIPCRNNLSWFPSLLERLDFEVVGFKYMCVDQKARMDTQLHSHFTDAGSPEFLDIDPEQSEKLPKSDLVLSFDGPQQWGVRKTWAFFLGLRKSRPKYIIVTNNPGQKNNDKERTLNLRKQPFHFTQPKRVISNVGTDGTPKQLVFYDTRNVREGF